MWKLMRSLFDLVYPSSVYCLQCERELVGWEVKMGLCSECIGQLRLFSGDGLSEVEGLEEQFFDQVQGVTLYQGLIKEWIYRLKYYGEREWIFPLMELMVEQGISGSWDGVIPIPLHANKLQQRGYNQALLLAQGLAFYLGIPCCDWLLRVKETLPQNQLKPGERQQNVHGVFALKENVQIQGKKWLIVDDIFTTGATVNEAARVLKFAGGIKVGVFVLASGRIM